MSNCYLFIGSIWVHLATPFDPIINTSCSLECLAIISRFRSGYRGHPPVHWNSPFRSTWGDHREGLARVTYRRYDI